MFHHRWTLTSKLLALKNGPKFSCEKFQTKLQLFFNPFLHKKFSIFFHEGNQEEFRFWVRALKDIVEVPANLSYMPHHVWASKVTKAPTGLAHNHFVGYGKERFVDCFSFFFFWWSVLRENQIQWWNMMFWSCLHLY